MPPKRNPPVAAMRAILPLMSKLDELEALAKEVSASTITILPKRCSYIRNWNSK